MLVGQSLAEHNALNVAGNPFLHSLTLFVSTLQRAVRAQHMEYIGKTMVLEGFSNF